MRPNLSAETVATVIEGWVQCPGCRGTILPGALEDTWKVCPLCGHHMRLSVQERILQLCDPESFVEITYGLTTPDPLNFFDSQAYAQRLNSMGGAEAICCGRAAIMGRPCLLAIMDFSCMGGSMGSVVGEAIVRLLEAAIDSRLPLLLVTASGGARMQEGVFSLLQMAKTAAAVARLRAAGLPLICMLTDPTSGGVTASFATLGDILVSEPGALVCFTGPRVIEQTLRQSLPQGAQRADFLKEHGMLDAVLHRKDQRRWLASVLGYLACC